MERHVVNGVRYEGEQLVALRLGVADSITRRWIKEPRAVPLLKVVDMLSLRDHIATCFEAEDGSIVSGPRLVPMQCDGGDESVETEGAPDGRRVADLPRLCP